MKKLIANTCLIGAVGMTMSACVVTSNTTDTLSNYDNGNDDSTQVITVSNVMTSNESGLLQASNDNGRNGGPSLGTSQSSTGSKTLGLSSNNQGSSSQEATEEDIANGDGKDKEANSASQDHDKDGSSSQEATEEDIANGDGKDKDSLSSQSHDKDGATSQEPDKDGASSQEPDKDAVDDKDGPQTSDQPVTEAEQAPDSAPSQGTAPQNPSNG